jgi:hypothetical protein
MNKALLFVFFSTITLAACGITPVKYNLTTSFNAEQAQALLLDGANTIKGSALLRQRGGGVVTCAGKAVQLTPATAYADERMTAIYGASDYGYRPVIPAIQFEFTDPRYLSFSKKTICDAQGFFKFSNIADGTFYVTTDIVWQVSSDAIFPEGGYVMKKITVKNGETSEIVLTQ